MTTKKIRKSGQMKKEQIMDRNEFNKGVSSMSNFKNGFTSWYETFYEVVSSIEWILSRSEESKHKNSKVVKIHEQQGRGGLYELAKDLTDEFESRYADEEPNGVFFDVIEEFMTEKLVL